MPLKRQNPGCACCCPPRAETGMPDALRVDFSGAAGTAAGMPADSVLGKCGANDILAHWRQSDDIIDLLTSMIFDYVSGPGDGCCYLYRSRGDSSACSTGTTHVLLGASPFEDTTVARWNGIVTTGINASVPGGDPTGACCEDVYLTATSAEMWGTPIHEWDDGTLRLARDSYAEAELRICIAGTIVTVTIVMQLAFSFDAIVGQNCHHRHDAIWNQTGGCSPPHCTCRGNFPGFTECTTGGMPQCQQTGGTITIEAQVDLAGVNGANLWEKIKAADWSGATFESQAIGPGGGCTGERTTIPWDVNIGYNCFVVLVPREDLRVTTYDAPIHQDCIWSIGAINLAFSDAS